MNDRWAEDNNLKSFKKIPIHIVEDHNDVLQYIYSAIGGKKLPLEGTTLVHLDAHPDLLLSRSLTGSDARAGRNVLPLLEIENWILPAVAAGHISRVVWIKPPWAHQMTEGTRTIGVGDHPETGLLRVDSTEPYYLSDALYSRNLYNKNQCELTVAELGDPDFLRDNEEEHVRNMSGNLDIATPYVLDIDLDFFSTGNPFLSVYEDIGLYEKLKTIFEVKLPEDDSLDSFEKVCREREEQLEELETLFQYLEQHGTLKYWNGVQSELFHKVQELSKLIIAESERLGEKPNWWTVFAAGCTCDQGGLPYHISSMQQIQSLINRSLKPFLKSLPPPVLITIARSSDDDYCPQDQVNEIQALVLQQIRDTFETDDPQLHYENGDN